MLADYHSPNRSLLAMSEPDTDTLTLLIQLQKALLEARTTQSVYYVSLELLKTASQVRRVGIVEAKRDGAGVLLGDWQSQWWSHSHSLSDRRLTQPVLAPALPSPWWDSLDKGEMIATRLLSLSTAERQWLKRQGIASVRLVPLMVRGQFYGAIWLEPCQHSGDWTATECQTWQAIAMTLALKIETVQANAEVAQLRQAQDEGIAAIAHELRSPLANIQMLTQMLEVSLEAEGLLQSNTSHYVNLLQEECQRKNSMINDLLTLARFTIAQEPVYPTEMALQDWVPYIAETFRDRFQQQQQHLTISIPAHIPPLRTDLHCLERIVTELLHNACKYTPAQGHITLAVKQKPKSLFGLCLEITNTGVEIPAQDLPRIFDKFYRIPTLDFWGQGGSGLGLPLVKKLVEHLGATIQVKSVRQQVKFILTFPSDLLIR
jgi:signal transduction histidine kinase